MTKQPGRPLRRDAEHNRQVIIATAKQVFAERGLQVTLDDIATRAGLGVGTVYRRFPNREALVGALFEDRIAEVAELARQAADVGERPWSAFRTLIIGLATLHAEDRGLRQVLLADDRAPSRFVTALARLRPQFQLIIERAQADGTLRPEITADDLPVLMAMISAAADRSGSDWTRYLAVILNGLHPEGEPR